MTCRNAQGYLADKKIAYEQRDFFKEKFTVDELRSLLKSLKLTAHDVVSTKSPAYKKMGLDKRAVSDEELLALMVQEPRLVRRPLIVSDGKPYFFKSPDQLVSIPTRNK